jgi:DNA-binding MarR family transcriptional regulator
MDYDVDIETYAERDERLANGPRQREVETALAALEVVHRDVEPTIDVLRTMIGGALREGDTYSLELAVDGLHRIYAIWSDKSVETNDVIERRGQLRELHNIASDFLEHSVPSSVLRQLEPDSLSHRMLVIIAERQRLSNTDIADELEVDKSQIARAGRRLIGAGLARARRAGRRNAWEITPRGFEVMGKLAQGGMPRPRGQRTLTH